MKEAILELRNLPRHRILEYLVEAGGEQVGPIMVIGDGWEACLEEMEPAAVGSFRIPRDQLVIVGEDPCVEQVNSFMRRKTMRGGG